MCVADEKTQVATPWKNLSNWIETKAAMAFIKIIHVVERIRIGVECDNIGIWLVPMSDEIEANESVNYPRK